MTKKDYEKAAAIVRRMAKEVSPSLRFKQIHLIPSPEEAAREAFIELFAGDNERFDAARFRAACEPK